jgi:hypothetical protein
MNEINEQPIRDRYCTHCGNLMDGYRYAEGYLSDTGEPFYRLHYTCPNASFFSRLIGRCDYVDESEELEEIFKV